MIKTMRFVICLPSERRCIGWRVLERFAAVILNVITTMYITMEKAMVEPG